ncbi:glycosyltransferase [Fusobacterium sp.]|uniref:glycosyltransferase n=1 Tax=Fusobacterium sp. TaxID=68766 RepID=UPI00396CAAED
MKTIVVNNPAAKEGGALTILTKFIENLYNSKCKNTFYIFVSVAELKRFEKENIKIIVLPKQNIISRIFWDNLGLKYFLNKNNIYSNIFLSIQNTGVNLPTEIPQLIYFHQCLSISSQNWSILKKEERTYWFYKNIYPFFIKQYLNRVTKVIVQTNWIKEEFERYFNVNDFKVAVFSPTILMPKIESISKIKKNKFRIFYPASPFIYKNHKLVLYSLSKLKERNEKLEETIECIFTFSEGENTFLDKIIKKYSLKNIVKLVGKLSYKETLEYYKSSDLLVFPSYIESFGLPLLEADYFGIPILALDLPYSRELKCKNIKYLDDNVSSWKEAIKFEYSEYKKSGIKYNSTNL